LEPVYLFSLASQQANWLSVRQATIAENVANANTPGYMARDVVPFSDVLDNTSALQMASTQNVHLASSSSLDPAVGIDSEDAWETTMSGNSVSLDQQMIQADEVNRGYSLNTGIVKAFQNMWLQTVKG
jgi:flagellar basal-body rod protein FlgB